MLSTKILKTGPGDPIVFLHGFLGRSEDWEAVCSHLPPCPCIGIDLPSHGDSPFVPHFDLPRAHIVGYSMGARLAVRFAKEPLSLTLLSIHPGLKTEREKQARWESDTKWAELLLQLPIDEFLLRWYDQSIFKPFVPDLTMRKKQNIYALKEALLHYSLAKQDYYELDNVLLGERDLKFRALHKNALLIPNAGHMVHLENPRAVAQIIQKRIGL
jgi:2-succinyl-6-hydroxy-2,4-cyclohexadiene-1-carboxylate synthase